MMLVVVMVKVHQRELWVLEVLEVHKLVWIIDGTELSIQILERHHWNFKTKTTSSRFCLSSLADWTSSNVSSNTDLSTNDSWIEVSCWHGNLILLNSSSSHVLLIFCEIIIKRL
jgi:hypothetical protein